MVQRKARNREPRERERLRGGGWEGWTWETLTHTAGGRSIRKKMLEADEITTSLLVDGNIKEALDL